VGTFERDFTKIVSPEFAAKIISRVRDGEIVFGLVNDQYCIGVVKAKAARTDQEKRGQHNRKRSRQDEPAMSAPAPNHQCSDFVSRLLTFASRSRRR
jgi:hypothetical protein